MEKTQKKKWNPRQSNFALIHFGPNLTKAKKFMLTCTRVMCLNIAPSVGPRSTLLSLCVRYPGGTTLCTASRAPSPSSFTLDSTSGEYTQEIKRREVGEVSTLPQPLTLTCINCSPPPKTTVPLQKLSRLTLLILPHWGTITFLVAFPKSCTHFVNSPFITLSSMSTPSVFSQNPDRQSTHKNN